MRIVVISGGESEEREVSLRSGERVSAALRKRGHEVLERVVRGAALPAALLREARAADAVFLCLHGGAGEDGTWQALLEAAGVFHYTGTGPRGSSLAMDKLRAKEAVAALGVRVARGELWQKGAAPSLSFPYIVKPRAGGSSVGLCVIRTEADVEKLAPSGDLLCEEYLSGREYSVGVLQGRALPPVEICPGDGMYDYAHKYTPGATKEICPAPLSAPRTAELQNLAMVCFCALGLRDFARVDFKEDAQGRVCFLEANTLPGMTDTSLLPLAAQTVGLSFPVLCEKMAQMAATRRKGKGDSPS